MAEDDSSHSELRQIAGRLEHLERVLQTYTARLYEIERRLNIDFRPAPHTHESRVDENVEAREAETTTSWQGRPSDRRGGGLFKARPRGESKPEEQRRRRDVESLVGGSWFNWLGIIAITFGVAFFLKYAFDSNWLGHGARVALGAIAGLAILALAELLRARGYRQYAYVLSGGGIVILYLSIFAAYRLYDLLGQTKAFILMSAVTAGAVALAVRHDARAIAVLGLVGGFFTPVLLSTNQDNQIALFTYVALLDAGVLSVAYFKEWRILNFLSFFATATMTVGWMEQHYAQPKLWTTLFFLTFLFLLFSALAPVHNILRRWPARWYDLLLVVLNATFFFTLSYALLDDARYDAWLDPLAFAVSAFFALLFYLAWRLHHADRLLAYGYIGAAVAFLAVALAIRLEQQWITVGWAIEGLVLMWVGLRAREGALRRMALVIFVVAAIRWFGWDMLDFGFRPGVEFMPLWNRRAFSAAVLVGSLVGAGWLYRRSAGELREDERTGALTFIALAANAVVLALLTLDVGDYFESSIRAGALTSVAQRDLRLAQGLSLSVVWAVYGGALLAFGYFRRSRLPRLLGLALLSLTTIKVFFWDLASLEKVYRIISFVVLGLILLAVSYLYQQRQSAGAAETGD